MGCGNTKVQAAPATSDEMATTKQESAAPPPLAKTASQSNHVQAADSPPESPRDDAPRPPPSPIPEPATPHPIAHDSSVYSINRDETVAGIRQSTVNSTASGKDNAAPTNGGPTAVVPGMTVSKSQSGNFDELKQDANAQKADDVKRMEVPQAVIDQVKTYIKWGIDQNCMNTEQAAIMLSYTSKFFEAEYAVQEHPLQKLLSAIENQATGVQIGTHKAGLSSYRRTFLGSDAVSWMLKNKFAASREEAVELGKDLVDHGCIMHHKAAKNFEDSDEFYRFTSSLVRNLGRTMTLERKLRDAPTWSSSMYNLIYHMHDRTVAEWLDTATADQLELAFPAILLWLHTECDPSNDIGKAVTERLKKAAEENAALKISLVGFCNANKGLGNFDVELTAAEQATFDMLEKSPPGDTIRHFYEAKTAIQHPFENKVASRPQLIKEFTSNIRPAWVKMLDEADTPIAPDIVCKSGDDLRKDQAVQLLFQAFASMWKVVDAKWRFGRAPYVRTYQVSTLSEDGGYLEFVPGKTVADVLADDEWKEVDLVKYAPSAIGSMVAGFVLGVRDRHSANWMLLGDYKKNPELLQIDFSFMFNEDPGGFPLDTPRLTMQPELVKLFLEAKGIKGETLMDDFQADMLQAFMILRRHYSALVSFARVVLSNVYTPEKVEQFMWGKHVFRADHSEQDVRDWFEDKMKSQLSTFVWRRGAKGLLVKAYYGVKSII